MLQNNLKTVLFGMSTWLTDADSYAQKTFLQKFVKTTKDSQIFNRKFCI